MNIHRAIKWLILSFVLFANYAGAQDIHSFTLNQTPLIMNPAFTGMFNGSLRVNTFYNTEWYGYASSGINNTYNTTGASADLPVYTGKNNSYVAAGMHVARVTSSPVYDYKSGSGSVSYHKILMCPHDSNRISDLSIGIRTSFNNSELISGWSPYGSSSLHAGISYSHATGKRFNYTIGLASFNIDDVIWQRDPYEKQIMQYIGELGASWAATEKLTLSPAIIIQVNSVFRYYVAGNDFNYLISKGGNQKKPPTSIVAGIYYSSDKDILFNAGIKSGAVRLGLGYNFSVAEVNNEYNAFRVLVQCQFGEYRTKAKQRKIPCSRF